PGCRQRAACARPVARRLCGGVWRHIVRARASAAQTARDTIAGAGLGTYALIDAHFVEAGHLGRIGEVECVERRADNARDDGVAVPFAVCGHDEPGGRIAAAAIESDA